jgi:hypothetical protein
MRRGHLSDDDQIPIDDDPDPDEDGDDTVHGVIEKPADDDK